MQKNKRFKVTAVFFLLCFFGVLLLTARQELKGQEIEEQEDCMDIFSYLSEDEEIKGQLENIIKEREDVYKRQMLLRMQRLQQKPIRGH